MKLAALFSFFLFTSLVQARVCTTSETLICGIAPICTSTYTIQCSDGTSKSFNGVTGPLGLGRGAYPQVKKWADEQGLAERKADKGLIFFYDRSEKPDARYCLTQLMTSTKTGINGSQGELHDIYVLCPHDSASSKLLKLVKKEDVEADLLSKGYRNFTSNKYAKTQYYRYTAD